MVRKIIPIVLLLAWSMVNLTVSVNADSNSVYGDPVQVMSETPGNDAELYIGSQLEGGMLSQSDGSSNKYNFIIPPLATDVNVTWPNDDGDPSDFLQTDGSGNWDWVPVPASAPTNAEYWVNASNATLTNEWVVTAGDGISFDKTPPTGGGALVVNSLFKLTPSIWIEPAISNRVIRVLCTSGSGPCIQGSTSDSAGYGGQFNNTASSGTGVGLIASTTSTDTESYGLRVDDIRLERNLDFDQATWSAPVSGKSRLNIPSDGPYWGTSAAGPFALFGSIRKNSTGTIFTRHRINLIEGSNVTITMADDAGNDEVDVTIAASGGGGGGGGITSLEGQTGSTQTFTDDTNVTITSAADTHVIGWSGQLGISRGGTNASTASAAFDNLSPLTTKGDLIGFDGTNNGRFPIGADTYYLRAKSSTTYGFEWAPFPSFYYQNMQDEGGALTNRTTMNFVGDNVEAADSGSVTQVTIRDYQQPMTPYGCYAINATDVTGATSNTCYAVYLGKAEVAITSCTINVNVTTAVATSITWAEVGIATGTWTPRSNANLTTRGTTSVTGTFNSTGTKSVSVTLTGITQSDDLWFVWGSQATTPFALRALQDDINNEGLMQSAAATRPSTMGAGTAFTKSNTLNPARVLVDL